MKNKTSYLFRENLNSEKSLKKVRGIELFHKLFDNYYSKLDLIKYKLFGEDTDNYGDIIINGEHYSPYKVNLDVLENHLSDIDLKLFRNININNKNKEKKIEKKTPINNDLKTFIKMIKQKKVSLINFLKIKNYNKKISTKIALSPKPSRNRYININAFSPGNSLISSSGIQLSTMINKIKNQNQNKQCLSTGITCKHRKKIIEENNSFNCPYDKHCIPRRYNMFSNMKKFEKRNLINKFDKEKYYKERKENIRRIKETLLIKNKINSLEKKCKIDSNNFTFKILSRDEQKVQFKKRFKFLISYYN